MLFKSFHHLKRGGNKHKIRRIADQRYKFMLKNIGTLSVSNFFSKALVFLLIPLYTNVLTTEEYGIYDVTVTTLQLLFPILTANICEAVMRFSLDKSLEKEKIVTTGLHIICGGICVFFFILVINHLFGFSKITIRYEILIFFYFVSLTANSYMNELARGLSRIADVAIAGAIGTFVTVVLNILLLSVYHRGLEGFFVATIFGQIAPALYQILRIRIWRYIQRFNGYRSLANRMLSYSLPMMTNSIGWVINSSLDKYVVLYFCGASESGILGVAYKIPMILNVVQSIFGQAWQISAIIEYNNEDVNDFYQQMYLYTNAFAILCCVILIVFSKAIANVLYAKDFFIAWQYAPFLLISFLFNSISGFLGPLLAAKLDSRTMAKSAIYGTLSNLFLNVVLVPFWGTQGAVIATAFSSFIICISRKKALEEVLGGKQNNWVYLSWVVLIFEAIIAVWWEMYGVELILIIGILFLYRKQFSNLMKIGKTRYR